MHRIPALVAAAGALALLAGCGDDDAASGVEDGTRSDGTVVVVAEDVGFGADAYEAEAGTVSFEYVNEGAIPHTLVVEGVDDFKLSVGSRGDADEGDVELEAGSYQLICDVPGHEQAGMVAVLEVR